MLTFTKAWNEKWILRSIIYSIYFNLKYLPFKQAIKLPILLYKPQLIKLKGKIIIESSHIKLGMIQLGRPNVPIYPNGGIIFENKGGTIIFKGKCVIGNNSSISIGEKGLLTIDDNFIASTTLKIICWYKINFKENTRIGWDCIFLDYDFHSMTKLPSMTKTKGYGEINIGKNNWFGSFCRIYKRTKTPDYCTIVSNSVLADKYDFPSHCIIGNNYSTTIKNQNIYRDLNNDTILIV